MDEAVAARHALHQLLMDGRIERCVDLLLRKPEDDRKCHDLGDVAKTGQLLQCMLRFSRQPGELPDHKVHHVVGVSSGMNAIEIPGPAGLSMIEGEHFLVGQRGNELNGEERIATRLLVHQLRQRRCPFRPDAKRVRNQLSEIFSSERIKCNLRTFPPAFLMISSLRISGWMAVTSFSR